MSPLKPVDRCICCGSSNLQLTFVLWKELIDEWRISPYEANYINRQQGLSCLDCDSNLRSMALAKAIMRSLSYEGFFCDFVEEDYTQNLNILEINEAGNLTKFLSRLSGHLLVGYPQIDMMQMPFENEEVDIIVHSDTLEHVQDPIRGLSECFRMLTTGGICAFTVPMVVDRLTVDREGLPPSYHGSGQVVADQLVQTEYGCDVWKHVIQAGFQECRIVALEFPAAQAFVGMK